MPIERLADMLVLPGDGILDDELGLKFEVEIESKLDDAAITDGKDHRLDIKAELVIDDRNGHCRISV